MHFIGTIGNSGFESNIKKQVVAKMGNKEITDSLFPSQGG